jgi:signal transduction histidine kinase
MAPAGLLFSLQSKLVFAFAVVVLIALAIAGAIFVSLRRGEQEEQELDHVIATSPAIYTEFSFLQRRGDPEGVLFEFAQAAADDNDLRILLLNRRDGTVAFDTRGNLVGEDVFVPAQVRTTLEQPVRGQPYVSWEPKEGPASDLRLVTALPTRLGQFNQLPPRGAELYWLVLAVDEETVTRAWLELLPALGIAAAVALPVAALLALLIAQYISGPLWRLTLASQRLAEGDYDVHVSVDRRDEVGRLAQAFSTMARRVGEAQSQMRALVANVSHDLKTPLTSILGFGQALRDGRAQDDAEVRRMGAVIHEEAERLTARLNDLLFLSELEGGQTVLQRDEVDLRRLIEGALERIGPELAARDVRLTSDLDDITVSADGPKLERALENLLENARKYTPEGGRLRVRAAREDGRARVEVANTARGLTDDEVPRLFERFYRHDRTRGDSDGSGLGLPIARDLIELHGGTLAALLQDGEIVFTISLPAA